MKYNTNVLIDTFYVNLMLEVIRLLMDKDISFKRM